MKKDEKHNELFIMISGSELSARGAKLAKQHKANINGKKTIYFGKWGVTGECDLVFDKGRYSIYSNQLNIEHGYAKRLL